MIAPGTRPHLARSLAELRSGARDPATVVLANRVVRATFSADGPVLIDVSVDVDGRVRVDSHDGQGPSTVDRHHLLGDDDPGHDLQPVHVAVRRAVQRFGSYRIPRTGNPYHELLPAVLAQRVTAAEATTQWRRMCLEYGVPLRVGDMELHTPPDPERLEHAPYTDLHLLGIDRRRAETLRAVARHANRLLGGWRVGSLPSEQTESLRLIPGVGQWTAAIAGYLAFCDADALEVGDFHAKNTVVYALTGRHRGSDTEMTELLAPYAGQRERVVRILSMDGWHAPAHGPRRPNVSIARL